MGANGNGQLGDGTWTSRSGPIQVATGVASVAAGEYHTLFVKTDGSLWAMGYNYYGQLGNGDLYTNYNTPQQVTTGVTSVSTGKDHTLFVKTDGSLWGMGSNFSGELGTETMKNSVQTPVHVANNVATVSVGNSFTLFVKTNSSLWAMGDNEYGQLGDGTKTDRSTPVQVATGVAAAAAGGEHSLFLSGERPAAPIMTAQPTAQSVTTKDVAQFSITATSSVPLTYQWQVSADGGTTWADLSDVTLYSGTTTSTLSVSKPTAAMKGYQYRCLVSDGVNAAIASSTASLTVKSSQFAALSARAPAGTGEQTLILGFVFAGGGKPTLVRGVGPGISSVSGYMMDPQLRVYTAGGVEVASNDDWPGTREFTDAFVQTGAGALDPASKDAALLQNLTGNVYTAHVSGANGTTGVALAEAYDVALSDKTKRLTALSVRNQVGVDDAILIAGFVINGDAPKRVIVRGVGPGISTVNGYLRDPQLQVWKLNTVTGKWTLSGENDDWDHTPETAALFQSAGMGALGSDSKDAALVLTLEPGIYTAQVAGVGRTTGVGVVEIYEAP